MAQPAVSSSEDRTELLGVPSFWGKPSAEPPYPWEVWIGQFFLAVSFKENCDPNILLTDPAEVHDDPHQDLNKFQIQKRQKKRTVEQQEMKRQSGEQTKRTKNKERRDPK